MDKQMRQKLSAIASGLAQRSFGCKNRISGWVWKGWTELRKWKRFRISKMKCETTTRCAQMFW